MTNTVSKATGYKINIQKSIAFPYTNNTFNKEKQKNSSIHNIHAYKKNLQEITKNAVDIHNGLLKHERKNLKKTFGGRKIFHVHRLAELILQK